MTCGALATHEVVVLDGARRLRCVTMAACCGRHAHALIVLYSYQESMPRRMVARRL